MKPVLLRRALAATLFIAPLVHAAPQEDSEITATAPRAVPIGMQAITAAAREIQNALEDGGSLTTNFDRLAEFQHSPETAKLLRDAFGEERLWSVQKRGVEDGKTAYRWLLNPLVRTTPEGNTLEWSEFPVDFWVDKTGQGVTYRGNWSSLVFDDNKLRFTMSDASLTGDQRRTTDNIWYGEAQARVGSMQFEGKDKPFSMLMRDMTVSTRVLEHERTADIDYGFNIKAIEVAGEQVDDVKFILRMVNLEKSALASLRDAEKKMRATPTAEPDFSAMLPMLKTYIRGAAKNKSALVVEDISFGFHGQRATLQGRVELGKVTEADLADMKRLGKRVNARFKVQVPMALVREIALSIARKEAAKRPEGGQDPEKMAGLVTDALLGKVLGSGFARLENEVLVSDIEVREEVLRINGKVVQMPKSTKAAKPAPKKGRARR